MKKIVKLTESDLHNMVREAVTIVLNETSDERLREFAEQIKGGYQPSGCTERDVDTLIRRGWVSVSDVSYTYGGEMPRFF